MRTRQPLWQWRSNEPTKPLLLEQTRAADLVSPPMLPWEVGSPLDVPEWTQGLRVKRSLLPSGRVANAIVLRPDLAVPPGTEGRSQGCRRDGHQ
jgi:hypothetical protein